MKWYFWLFKVSANYKFAFYIYKSILRGKRLTISQMFLNMITFEYYIICNTCNLSSDKYLHSIQYASKNERNMYKDLVLAASLLSGR